MPGGWCEFNLSPADNIVKETKEEAGLDVSVKMVIAVQDRNKHNHPPYAICARFLEANSLKIQRHLKAGIFSKDKLPILAEEKCNKEQIMMCFEAYQSNYWTVIFD